MSAENPPTPEAKRKISAKDRLRIKVSTKAVELAVGLAYGKEYRKKLPAMIAGISVDGMIGNRLCYPDEEAQNRLVLHRADNAAYLSYDPRKPLFFPPIENDPDRLGIYGEGSLAAFMLDGIEDRPQDELTMIMPHEWMTPEVLFTVDKPGLERLLELGMLARRSHELAFEHAGMEHYIDDLRARRMHDEIVYQVTPKGNCLVFVEPDSGDPTPKREAKPALDRIPGLIAQPAV